MKASEVTAGLTSVAADAMARIINRVRATNNNRRRRQKCGARPKTGEREPADE